MNHRVRAEIIGLLLCFALFAINSSARAQDPAASPSPAQALLLPDWPQPSPERFRLDLRIGDRASWL
jgi:hypothetical protein